MDRLYDLVPGQTPNVSRYADVVDWDSPEDFGGIVDQHRVRVSGYIKIDVAGEYEFLLTSDDGAKLWLDQDATGEPLIDDDGVPGPAEAKVELTAGLHPFSLHMFEDIFLEELRLQWKPPGASDFAVLPESNLRVEKDVVHVTSPGKKRIVQAGYGGPGDGAPVSGVHPAFDLVDLRPAEFEFPISAMEFLPTGQLLVGTWGGVGSEDDRLLLVDGVTGASKDSVSVSTFASDLEEPMGIQVVEGAVYVAEKSQITKFVDTDGDGRADERTAFIDDLPYGGNFHEWPLGFLFHEGSFYIALSVAIEFGGSTLDPQPAADRGTLLRANLAGEWEIIASGMRTPNGMASGPSGELFGTDNQGDWLPSSKLNHYQEGAHYGHQTNPPGKYQSQEPTPPALWLPHNEISLSPSGLAFVPAGLPFAGQLMVGDVTHGGVKRIALEKVDGVYQGAVFRFSQGFEAGINRLVWFEDELYVGGIGAEGNWGQPGKLWYGLQKLRANGNAVFEMERINVRPGGLEIEFTMPVDTQLAGDPSSYELSDYRYVPTDSYGGEKVDERELTITGVEVAADGTSAVLSVPALEAGRVVYLRLVDVKSASGQNPWATEAWYTLNRLPED